MPFASGTRRDLLSGAVAAAVMSGPGAPATAAEPCPAAPFRTSLMQLLRRDAGRPAATWPALMRDLRRFGLRELILQWTSIGDVDFFGGRPDAEAAMPILPSILRAAHGAGMRLWVGLHHDPRWWSASSCPSRELDSWFAQRLAALDARLPALQASLAAAPARTVVGWYVSDELDDGTWKAPDREAALARYLRAVTDRLSRDAPDRPVAISAFANGEQSPALFGGQLRRLAEAARIERLLLQDGIGAGKRDLVQARETARGVAQALHGSAVRLSVIVELFDLRKDSGAAEAATVPASLSDILARLDATAGIGDTDPASFSHVHHLTDLGGAEAAARGQAWLQLLRRCGGR